MIFFGEMDSGRESSPTSRNQEEGLSLDVSGMRVRTCIVSPHVEQFLIYYITV